MVSFKELQWLALLTNMRLGWKWLSLTNALAYNTEVSITGIKSFVVQAQVRVYPKKVYVKIFDQISYR
jgi:hypothetical protein